MTQDKLREKEWTLASEIAKAVRVNDKSLDPDEYILKLRILVLIREAIEQPKSAMPCYDKQAAEGDW